jgi:hypothetical protein
MKNSPSHLKQPLLPASARQAIGIALLASLPTACTPQKQANTPSSHSATVDIQSAMPVNIESIEPPQEDIYFTPNKALQLALSEPLEFKGRKLTDSWRGYGYYEHYWQNSKVMVITGITEKLPQAEVYEIKDQSIRVSIISPEGEIIVIKANTAIPSKTIYNASKRAYGTSFEIRYQDLGAVEPKYTGGLSIEAYLEFQEHLQKNVFNQLTYPNCSVAHSSLLKSYLECSYFPKNHPLGHTLEDFWRNPDKEWFDFLGEIKKLHREHGFR